MVTGRKLLLADDSVTIQKVVDLTFSDEGLEVITVSDGQQALEKLEEFTPDIVLADVFMPGLNGYQICEHIKRTERLSHIPVMLLVGSFEPFDEAEARRVGADDYLTKPFQSIRTLIGKVRNLLTGRGAESDEQPTRQLAPPPEAEKENRSNADFMERSTADTAPLPTNINEGAEREGQSREISFADLSMDDQMIETSPASDYASTGHTIQNRATAAYSAADLREAGITQPVENAPEAHEEPVAAFVQAQAAEPSPAASIQPQSAARISSVASADDALLDLGDMEPPSAMIEADDFLIDLLDEAPPQARTSEQTFIEPSEPSFAETSAHVVEEADASAPFDFEEAAPSPQAQVIGEESVAEFAPIGTEATPAAEQETQFSQESPVDYQSAPTERLPEGFQVEGGRSASPQIATGGAATATESQAPPATGQITLEQLSPEVIDAIARRAVEQLSERVVEQIAWEVVPALAELLIKRRLDEEKQ